MRRLLEQNFNLKYNRFALDEAGNIAIIFDTYPGWLPYKLYYALKEVATKADKQDDLLLEEFKSLQSVDTTTWKNATGRKTKIQLYRHRPDQTGPGGKSGKLDKIQYSGSIGYLLLDLIYRLDYLIKPEGFMMKPRTLHRKYYENDGMATAR